MTELFDQDADADAGDDADTVTAFVSIVRRGDGSVHVDHCGDEDVALALLARAQFTLLDPDTEVDS